MNSHNTETSMSVLERQRSTIKLHQKQLTQTKPFANFYQNEHFGDFLLNNYSNDQISFNSETLLNGAMKSEHDAENNIWNDGFGGLLSCTGNELELHEMTSNRMIPRTDSIRKRKADKSHDIIEAVAEEKSQKRNMKGCEEKEESKITEQDSNSKSTITFTVDDSSKNSDKSKKRASKNNSKDDSKTDYIHVRARRGQATDSHSLAERVRREKISERMRFLQDLVPGCNKVTGKAGMLDEIINYVQSLQKQVEFLSMKLAAVNSTTLDFDVMNGLSKEVLLNPDQLQFNTLLQELPCFGIISPRDIGTIGAPVSIQDPFFDSSCFNVCGDAGDVMIIQGLEGAQF